MKTKAALVVALTWIVIGCASSAKPVLYPNAHLKQVGQQQAEADIDDCRQLAESSGADAHDAGRVARPAAQGAATGAAVGGVGSAVRHGNVGAGVAGGAAVGAAAGVVTGAFRAGDVSPVHRAFVQRCMKERGYDVIGWK